MGKKSKGAKSSKAQKLPKTKCCESKSRCGRCPLRMLKEGTLPDGMTVKRRKLVTTRDGKPVSKKQLKKAA
ncbi:MAG: hypothetical protein QM572_13430 [Nocardioides sp.]|uniref:hypothetical protein n=1 Tax=Nocardioides sp. TaxID=35761 RepID=UPI0039E46F45